MSENEFNTPLSRNEAILQNILGASNELGNPLSREEALLMKISDLIEGIDAEVEDLSEVYILNWLSANPSESDISQNLTVLRKISADQPGKHAILIHRGSYYFPVIYLGNVVVGGIDMSSGVPWFRSIRGSTIANYQQIETLLVNQGQFDESDMEHGATQSSTAAYILQELTKERPADGTITLLANAWTDNQDGTYTQPVTILGSTANSEINLKADKALIKQFIQSGIQGLYIANTNGTLTAELVGTVPEVSITVPYSMEEVRIV